MNEESPIVEYIRQCMAILVEDSDTMETCEQYFRGNHELPYMPDTAEAEYRLLARRAITNWMPLIVNTPAQGLYVDNFRKSTETPLGGPRDSDEWLAWERSGMAARQHSVYVEALKLGHSFVLTEKRKDGELTYRGLSARRTVALYDDPASDIDPEFAMYLRRRPTAGKKGIVYAWDAENRYEFEYESEGEYTLVDAEPHGSTSCPVTRFAPNVDLEGRTWGVVEPLIPVQDRINQTIFDLLVAQTYTSFEVRTVTGMAPPVQMQQGEDGIMEPVLDANGNPVPDRVFLNASRFMFAEDPEAKFGSLPGGKLDGVIASAELAIRHLSALSQTPPHFLLGQIANIAAEALEAAEVSLSRKIDSFRNSFGESWERVFRIGTEILGETGAAPDYSGEVVWRDLGVSSLAQTADGLGKFADSLGIPPQGLWPRIPNVSRSELAEWRRLLDEANTDKRLVDQAVGMFNGPASRGPAAPSRFGQEAVTADVDTAA